MRVHAQGQLGFPSASPSPRLSLWLQYTFLRAYGATESLPPEDADVIVDNAATGATLKANSLEVFDTLINSTTRLYASKEAWASALPRPSPALDP